MEEIVKSAEKAAGASFADVIERLYEAGISRAGVAKDKARLKFNLGFQEYLSSIITRCRYTKTLIDRHEPVEIENLYVDLTYKIGNAVYENSGIIGRVKAGKQIIVTGLAGSGKSITLKKLCMELASSGSVIPIFVELRNLSGRTLEEYVCNEISEHCGNFSEEAFLFGLRKGMVCLILDGFDEIPPRNRVSVEREIHELIASAPNCQMLISGRPHERYQSWHSVAEARIQDLSKDQVLGLIGKYKFDEDAKLSLSRDIEKRLYNTHRKLLSNALLSTLMLLTYHEFSEIPKSLHVYYRKAFEVLVRKHDALKPMYVREFYSKCSEENFRKIFETFCYLSFVDGVFNFSRADVLRYISEAVEYEAAGEDSESLLQDLVENVCIILAEGDNYSFLHRSFQEYFCANFVISRNHDDIKDIIDGMSDTFLTAGVLNFMIDMNIEVLERRYLIPAVSETLVFLKRYDDEYQLFSLIISGLLVLEDRECIPIVDVNTSRWIEPAFVAIQLISGRKFALNKVEEKLYQRISKVRYSKVLGGRRGIQVLSDDELFREIVLSMGYGKALMSYYREVGALANEKEARRAKIIKKYNTVRHR